MEVVDNLSVCSPLENDEVQDVLREGTDLRQYSRQIEQHLKKVESQSVLEYAKESENIVSLHRQIAACDDILERMESMLVGFKSDLGSISSEIVYLQRKSVAMSQQLHNRQAVRAHLTHFIGDIAIPEQLVLGISEAQVTDAEFATQLAALELKSAAAAEQAGARAVTDVAEILANLRIQAAAKIRVFLLQQVATFRKPLKNYQLHQNSMLKHKKLFEFILSHQEMVAQEIRNEYLDTMSKMYWSYFKSYVSSLNKLMYEEQATKDDLVGADEVGSRGRGKQRAPVFAIETRAKVLGPLLDAPIIIPHSAAGVKCPYEELFRSEQYALVDNACREYLFVSEFFCAEPLMAKLLFSQIMDRTLDLLRNEVNTHISNSYDCIGLQLCIQLVHRYRLMCHKRAVPALDTYWDNLLDCLWPRFKYVFKLNIDSIQNFDLSKFNKEFKPHFVTRRYAELSGALVAVGEQFPDEELSHLLASLAVQAQYLLMQMAAAFDERLDQLVFLINNYDAALAVLSERTREVGCKEAEMLRDNLTTHSNEYVQEVLTTHVGGVVNLVQEAERLQAQGATDQLTRLLGQCGTIIEAFSATWRQSLQALKRKILSSFPNLVTGSTLLQLSLAAFLQYYERLHKVLPPETRTALVNVHHIKIELKKYKTNYS